MRRSLLQIPILAISALAAGCQPTPPEKIDQATWTSPQAVSVNHTSSVAAAEGALPLAYEVGATGVVNVVDQSTGKSVGTGEARAGQIVAVSAGKGVTIGGVSISGPVPADHRFTIMLQISNPEAGPPAQEKK